MPRQPRFVLRTGRGSAAGGQDNRAAQASAEFSSFLAALDAVESSAGRSLAQMPHERLSEIQSILRQGGGVLQPLPRSSHSERLLSSDGGSQAGAPPPSESQGLSHSEIGRLHSFTMRRDACADVETCAVCLGEMQHGDTCTALACTHKYHHECVARWLELSRTCPLCKAHPLQPSPKAHKPSQMSPIDSAGGGFNGAAFGVHLQRTEEAEEAGQNLMFAAANAIATSRASQAQQRAQSSTSPLPPLGVASAAPSAAGGSRTALADRLHLSRMVGSTPGATPLVVRSVARPSPGTSSHSSHSSRPPGGALVPTLDLMARSSPLSPDGPARARMRLFAGDAPDRTLAVRGIRR